MKLQLPDVTLVMVETREHKLARMAIEDCLDVAEFGEVLVLTDNKTPFFGIDARFVKVPDWPEKIGWSRSWWYDVPPLLRTRQTLNIQWDSWIIDASQWDDAWLQYDYIGAPWWYQDEDGGKNVGNGGFSLVSTALKRYLAKHRDKYPCDTCIDDDLLCRKYRPQLEKEGFRWAPEHVADKFSYEGCGKEPRPFRKHFGFHAMFNWPKVLKKEPLMDRLEIATQSEYIFHPDSYMFKGFCQTNPEVAKELLKRSERQSQGAS